MDGCLPLVLLAFSMVLLIAPIISLVLNFRNRARVKELESELRTLSAGLRYLRSRFDEKERKEKTDRGTESEPEVPAEDEHEPVAAQRLGADAAEAPPVVEEPLSTQAPPSVDRPAAFEARTEVSKPDEKREAADGQPEEPSPVEGDEALDEERAEPSLESAPKLPEEPEPDVGPEVVAEPEVPSQPASPPPPAFRPQPVSPPPVSPPPVSPQPSAGFDWESLVGVKLFSWIAGIALALAAVFFLKYSIDHGWLGPEIRMALGFAAGIALVLVSERRFADNYRVTANAMDAAGVAILYATLFAGHDLWGLLPQSLTFVLMIVVTVLAVYLSARRDSAFIALLGLLGGFSTPVLLTSGEEPISLFGYLLVLNAGIAWIAHRKKWPFLSLLSLIFTTIYQWVWVVRFLDGPQVPVAIGIFLVFPIAGVMTIWIAKSRDEESAGGLFEWTTQTGAVLPFLFAFYGAAIPEFGSRPGLLFFFLLCAAGGLGVIALLGRVSSALHLLGGVSTLIVFAIWLAMSWTPSAWPTILGWVSIFILFYALVPEVVRWRQIALGKSGMAARYTAPLLFFVFPVLVTIEDRTSDPVLLFSVLFGLLVILTALSMRQERPLLYVPAAFLAVLTEAQWGGEHLTSANLTTGLVVFSVFTALYIAAPLVAARMNRMLGASRGAAVPLLASFIVFLLAHDDKFATGSLFTITVLIVAVIVTLQVLSARVERQLALLSGIVFGWITLGALWTGLELVDQLVGAVFSIALFVSVVSGGSVWLAGRREKGGEPALYLGLIVYLFAFVVVAQSKLSGQWGPVVSLLLVAGLTLAVGATLSRTPAVHLGSALLGQAVLLVWVETVKTPDLVLLVLVASVAAAFLALGTWIVAREGLYYGPSIHALAAAVGGILAHFVVIGTMMKTVAPHWSMPLVAHLALIGVAFTVAWKTGQHVAAIAPILPTALACFWWKSHTTPPAASVEIIFATCIYFAFILYPVLLGKRAGSSRGPYVVAIAASVPYFFVVREVLDRIDFSFIAILPIGQAAVMGGLVLLLLRLEPEGSRTLGRLALTVGTMLAFVTVAIPLQLDKEWITIGWALEAAALVWVYLRIPHRGLLATAAALYAVVFVRLAFNPAVFDYHPRTTTPIWNWYLYTYLVPVVAMFVGVKLLEEKSAWMSRFRAALSTAGTVLLFLLLNIEIADFFSEGDALTFDFDAGLGQDLTYTIAWALFAIAMLIVGIAKGIKPARIASLALLVIAIAKCFLHDLMRLGGLYRVASLVGLAVSLAVVALLLQKFVLSRPGREEKDGETARPQDGGA